MDFLAPGNTFIVVCPTCKKLAFDPQICFQCNSEIPTSTRVRIVDKHNRVFEITGYHLKNFSEATFAFLKEVSSSENRQKAAVFPKPDAQPYLKRHHGENCACVKYLKTDEEVKKNSLITVGEEDTAEGEGEEEDTAEPYQHVAEEHVHNSDSLSASSLVQPWRLLTIYDEDMVCLADGEQLNDSIIDFYLNYVYYEIVPQEFQALTHIFSSCFNKFLMTVFEEKNTSKNWLDLEKSVKKWVKNVDIFSKDFIFIPINRRNHWYLAVICFLTQLNKKSNEPKESLEKDVFADSSSDARQDHPYKKGKPCICFFDSYNKSSILGKEKLLVARTLKEFLKVLWNSKNPTEPYDWDNLRCLKAVCPQQDNSVDCGLYLLQYVESFFKNPIPYFESPMPIMKNWFSKQTMANKRKQIKEVISEIRIKKPKTSQSSGSDVIVLSPEHQD